MSKKSVRVAMVLMSGLVCIPLQSGAVTLPHQAGTLNFRGEIVEKTCDLMTTHQQVSVACPMENTAINMPFTRDVGQAGVLADHRGDVQMKWYGTEHQIGIMTVNYR
ncbi:hypothetical protein PUG81_02105 [Erwiniaceae bacterium L1_54_6]|jgi:hypothetical protein|nr:hypothetical protein [Erwiniaceae bacterium L1_54_6]